MCAVVLVCVCRRCRCRCRCRCQSLSLSLSLSPPLSLPLSPRPVTLTRERGQPLICPKCFAPSAPPSPWFSTFWKVKGEEVPSMAQIHCGAKTDIFECAVSIYGSSASRGQRSVESYFAWMISCAHCSASCSRIVRSFG